MAGVSGAEAQYHDESVTTSDAKPRLPRLGNAALKRPTSADQVAAYVRQQILAGVLKPGTHVPQDEIATALNVSRIPVREAIIALEREGWVTHLVHRGAFVNRVDEDLIRDHYALFGLLYGYAARKVGAAPDAALLAELAELESALADCDDASEAEPVAIAFHAAIVAGSNTPRLKVLLRAMSSIFPETSSKRSRAPSTTSAEGKLPSFAPSAAAMAIAPPTSTPRRWRASAPA